MPETIDLVGMRRFLEALASNVMNQRDYLGQLDAACGDGDFGVTMYVAFGLVRKALSEAHENDIGELFEKAGKAILSSTGGASGPLFWTFFNEAGHAAKSKKQVGVDDLAQMFRKALSGVEIRGGAVVGDKTLVDALDPAVLALEKASVDRLGLSQALEVASQAARNGSESTRNLTAKRGKGRYLAEQTVGHLDPGGEVIRIFFETLAAATKAAGS